MKLTFEMVAATDLNMFNKVVNQKLAQNYKFVTGMATIVTEHEDITGKGFQYSVAMILEEEG